MAELEEVAEAATEVVAMGAEEVASTATDFAVAARNMSAVKIKFAVLGGLIGAAAGGIIGYQVAYKRLETKFEKIAEDEIDEMREHFRARMIAREEKPDLDAAAEEIKKREGYVPQDEAAVPPAPAEPETKNVFEERRDSAPEPGPAWDPVAEAAARKPGVPYVIQKEEYGEKEDDGISTTTLTYYAGDDVLADAKDKPVDDQDAVVGVANLDKFGHGSGDSEVVFIRNEELGLDVEVVKSSKTFAEEVHGFKHSDSEPRRSRRSQLADE